MSPELGRTDNLRRNGCMDQLDLFNIDHKRKFSGPEEEWRTLRNKRKRLEILSSLLAIDVAHDHLFVWSLSSFVFLLG